MGTLVVSMVVSLAVVAVLACWAIPDGVSGADLLTEVAPVREWKGSGGATSWSIMLRYCRNVRPTWVKFNSKDTKESGVGSRF